MANLDEMEKTARFEELLNYLEKNSNMIAAALIESQEDGKIKQLQSPIGAFELEYIHRVIF